MEYFTRAENRSERAKQADILVPALDNKEIRYELLKRHGIEKGESDKAQVLHFVWVLRDQFYADRELNKDENVWDSLIKKWVRILKLDSWAQDRKYWTAEIGKKNRLGIVHPCQKSIGWTKVNPRLKGMNDKKIDALIQKRKMMNTETDCFIQTSKRLIIIECKDKTYPKEEQRVRQRQLIQSLKVLLPREHEPIYIELTNNKRKPKDWTWTKIIELLN